MTNKYLIIAPSWIGDAIMANALFRALKEENSHCIIDVLAPEWSHPVFARMTEVHRTISMPIKHGRLGWSARRQLGCSLRNAKYDQAIVLPNSWKSALIPWFAKIPKRTGWRGEWRYGLLNDLRLLDKKRYPLMVEHYLGLGSLSIENIKRYYPSLQVNNHAREIAIQKYDLSSNKPLLMLCPGAQYGASKRWPENYFAEVARYFLEKEWQIGLLGGTSERSFVEKIRTQVADKISQASYLQRLFDLTSTTLAEAMDLTSFADVVVSNDSGLMHMACALNRPVVAIYGSSSPDFTPPLSDNATILSKSLPCKPCFQRECPFHHLNCLKMITPHEVIQAIEKS